MMLIKTCTLVYFEEIEKSFKHLICLVIAARLERATHSLEGCFRGKSPLSKTLVISKFISKYQALTRFSETCLDSLKAAQIASVLIKIRTFLGSSLKAFLINIGGCFLWVRVVIAHLR